MRKTKISQMWPSVQTGMQTQLKNQCPILSSSLHVHPLESSLRLSYPEVRADANRLNVITKKGKKSMKNKQEFPNWADRSFSPLDFFCRFPNIALE